MPTRIPLSLATILFGKQVAGSSDLSRRIHELVATIADPDRNVGLVARRALWHLVRHAGRPGAAAEKEAVITTLTGILQLETAIEINREIVWMLSEIGGDESVESIAVLLGDEALREDARMALERIPTQKAVAALENALDAAPADFQYHVAQSLRNRGVTVAGLPCQKLVPTKETTIQATE